MRRSGARAAAAPEATPAPPAKVWPVLAAEFVGTALLVAVGCSFVVLDFGAGSPAARLLPADGARRALTGFLFGGTGALVAISPVGKLSGAHLNPAVTLAFWLLRRIETRLAAAYVVAQLAGALAGALALRAWGAMGASVRFGATLPGRPGVWVATLGEAAATFCLVAGLLAFLRHPRLRAVTPGLFPVLYAVLVWLEAPLSGTSTNPARSLGPALVAGDLHGWWIYWLGPFLGTVGGVAVHRLRWARAVEIRVAKVFHFGHDRFGVFAHTAARARRERRPALR